jgi:hypothetical protein
MHLPRDLAGVEALPGFQIPHPQRPVVAPRHGPSTVPHHAHARDRSRGALQNSNWKLNVPVPVPVPKCKEYGTDCGRRDAVPLNAKAPFKVLRFSNELRRHNNKRRDEPPGALRGSVSPRIRMHA